MVFNKKFMYAVIDWNYRNGQKSTRVEIRDKITGRCITGINYLTTSKEAWDFATHFTGDVVDLRYQ